MQDSHPSDSEHDSVEEIAGTSAMNYMFNLIYGSCCIGESSLISPTQCPFLVASSKKRSG
jgi:hypothetical protein